MNKAVIGVFGDHLSASRAINDLKAYGFGGETITQVLREDLLRGERLPGPRIMPAMEILKGLVIGIVAGGILGALAYYLLDVTVGMSAYGLSSPLYAAVALGLVIGGICGLLEGLAAMGPLMRACRALDTRRRGDAVVTVHTDETHSNKAADILRSAGAIDVRRGASSIADEFRTSEAVQPEVYGTTPVVQREPVTAPGEAIDATTTGGAVG
jgi:hypothetical protein